MTEEELYKTFEATSNRLYQHLEIVLEVSDLEAALILESGKFIFRVVESNTSHAVQYHTRITRDMVGGWIFSNGCTIKPEDCSSIERFDLALGKVLGCHGGDDVC